MNIKSSKNGNMHQRNKHRKLKKNKKIKVGLHSKGAPKQIGSREGVKVWLCFSRLQRGKGRK